MTMDKSLRVRRGLLRSRSVLTRAERLTRLQEAFIGAGAVQCGFCTSGMLLAATALLAERPHASIDEIRAGLAGNICRCTGYRKIVDAVLAVASGRAP